MFHELSRTEKEVFKLLIKGLTNQQMADKLFVTEKTVKFHITNIYKKMGYKNRGEAIVSGIKLFEGEASQTFIDSVDNEKSEDNDMANWQPANPAVLPQSPAQHEKTTALARIEESRGHLKSVVDTFGVNETIQHLQHLSKEVTKKECTVEAVMAACQCIGRINETVNTTMKAFSVLRNVR